MKIKEKILQLFFPRRCPVCDEIVSPFGEKICPECEKKLVLLTPPWCMKCGKKLYDETEYCKDCKTKPHFYHRGRSLYEYKSVAKSIYRFKYGQRQEYADFFGEMLYFYLKEFLEQTKAQAIIPVPMYSKKQKKKRI